jgi:hypothetical protein
MRRRKGSATGARPRDPKEPSRVPQLRQTVNLPGTSGEGREIANVSADLLIALDDIRKKFGQLSDIRTLTLRFKQFDDIQTQHLDDIRRLLKELFDSQSKLQIAFSEPADVFVSQVRSKLEAALKPTDVLVNEVRTLTQYFNYLVVSQSKLEAALKNRPGGSVNKEKSSERHVVEAEPHEFSSKDWNEIKSQALEILKANSLDTPERHLAYVREQLSLAAVGDVQ